MSLMPTRSESGETVYTVDSSSSGAVNQSRRGPGVTRRTGVRATPGAVPSRATGKAPGVPTGSSIPAASGGGPSFPSVSVEREPSTGGTSMPPRTAT